MKLTLALLAIALVAAVACAVSGSGPAGALREAANTRHAERMEAFSLIQAPR